MAAVAFADSDHGWAVGQSCQSSCEIEFSTTADGGSHWTAPEVVGTAALSNGYAEARLQVRYVGVDGWIFGPGLFSTHDGGRTWRQQSSATVYDLEPAEGTVIAAVECSIADLACANPHLEISAARSDSWSSPTEQPGLPGKSILAGSVVMERARGGTDYLAYQTLDRSQLLFSSHGTGATWSPLTAPCSGVSSIRSLDSRRVWMLCSTPCCTGNYVKAAELSNDGGNDWTSTSAAGPTTRGSIAFTGPAVGLVVTSSNVAMYGSSGEQGIWRTSDSGIDWTPAYVNACNQGGIVEDELWFADAAHGWAVATAATSHCPPLIRSVDGGVTWAPAASPFS